MMTPVARPAYFSLSCTGHGLPALQNRHFRRSTAVGIGLIIRPYFRRGTATGAHGAG